MMKRSALMIACILGMMVMAAPAFAYTFGHYPYPCPGGGSAYVDVWWDDSGHPIYQHGVFCNGSSYMAYPGNVHQSGTNLNGNVSQFYEVTALGLGWCRFNMDVNGNIIQLWGQTSDGMYYEVLGWVPDGGGGGIQ